jgi:hypothetical protein
MRMLRERVFPALTEAALRQRVRLIFIDPSEAGVESRARELDRCCTVGGGVGDGDADAADAAKTTPIMLVLVGDRYGKRPPQHEVPPAAREMLDWVDGMSSGACEILHGAYRTKSPTAVAVLRDSRAFLDDPRFRALPDEVHNSFVETIHQMDPTPVTTQLSQTKRYIDPAQWLHAQTLKDRIASRFADSRFVRRRLLMLTFFFFFF